MRKPFGEICGRLAWLASAVAGMLLLAIPPAQAARNPSRVRVTRPATRIPTRVSPRRALGVRSTAVGPARRGAGRNRGRAGNTRGNAGRNGGYLPAGARNALRSRRGGAETPIKPELEVRSLLERHTGLAANLPPELQRSDRRALPLVQKLPYPAQLGYLATLEQYANLLPDEQTRVTKAVRTLSELKEPESAGFVTKATAAYRSSGGSSGSMKAIRAQPLGVLWNLEQLADAARIEAGKQ